MAGFFSRARLQIICFAVIITLGAAFSALAQNGGYDAPYPAQEHPSQQPYQSYHPVQQPSEMLSQNELANLVAPIALYPDALLAQVLVASTYPDQLGEAEQFLQQNGNLPGPERMQAAQQQNWDPSVQALVAFPAVVDRMTGDLQWTTELGNAFLTQQADVMSAIQNLRAEARQSGQLQSTPQLSVNTEVQGDRSAIEIQPADPQRIFIPSYDPYVVWGPPAVGAYPALPYAQGSGFGALIGTVANLAGLLPGFGGFLGPRSWGWALSWLVNALFVNNSFFSDFGFHGYGGAYPGMSLWVHDGHRSFGGRFGNSSVAGWRGRGSVGGENWRTFGNNSRGGYHGYGGEFFERSRTTAPNSIRGGMISDRGRDSRQVDSNYRRSQYQSFGNSSAANRANSFSGSRSFAPSSRNTGFAIFNRGSGRETSRTLMASRAWDPSPGGRSWSNRSSQRQPNFSARSIDERGPAFGRESSSGHHSSWKSAFSSHSHEPRPKHYSAAKFSAPHFKSHGGGHSSHGHSGGKHRG